MLLRSLPRCDWEYWNWPRGRSPSGDIGGERARLVRQLEPVRERNEQALSQAHRARQRAETESRVLLHDQCDLRVTRQWAHAAVGDRDQTCAPLHRSLDNLKRLFGIGSIGDRNHHVVLAYRTHLAKMHAAECGDQADTPVGMLQRVLEVRRDRKRAARSGDPDRVSVGKQIYGLLEARALQTVAKLLHAGDAAAEELVRYIQGRQAAGARVNQVAHARCVVAAGCNLARQPVAEDPLHFGEARETEMLRETHYRRGLYLASGGHVLDAFEAKVVAMLLDVERDNLELLAQVTVLLRDALEQLFDGHLRGGSNHGVRPLQIESPIVDLGSVFRNVISR